MVSRPSYIYQLYWARENNKRTKANNGEIHLFVVGIVILTVTLLYLEQCPAKSPLQYYQILQDKPKKSNARIEMYG